MKKLQKITLNNFEQLSTFEASKIIGGSDPYLPYGYKLGAYVNGSWNPYAVITPNGSIYIGCQFGSYGISGGYNVSNGSYGIYGSYSNDKWNASGYYGSNGYGVYGSYNNGPWNVNGYYGSNGYSVYGSYNNGPWNVNGYYGSNGYGANYSNGKWSYGVNYSNGYYNGSVKYEF